MSRLLPIRAGFYSDPSSTTNVSETTLDISGVYSPDSAFAWPPDTLAQPSHWQLAQEAGVVTIHLDPALYIVRSGWHDAEGSPHQNSGVIGVTRRPVSNLTQPTTISVSSAAFSDLLVPEGVPVVRATVGDCHFRVWAVRRTGIIETIGDAVEQFAADSTSPFVLATSESFSVPPGLVFCLSESILEDATRVGQS